MKLVEILAEDLKEWPEGVDGIVQDGNCKVYIFKQSSRPYFTYNQWYDVGYEKSVTDLDLPLADDYQTTMVTQKMWLLEKANKLQEETEMTQAVARPLTQAVAPLKYKVGDKVVLGDVDMQHGSKVGFFPGDEVVITDLNWVGTEDQHYTVKTSNEEWWVTDPEIAYLVPENRKLAEHKHSTVDDSSTHAATDWKVVRGVNCKQTEPSPDESFQSVFTSISVGRKRNNTEPFCLYDDSVTTITLDDDAGGMYLRISQDCEGQYQYLKFDFDEIGAIMDAINKLISQKGVLM